MPERREGSDDVVALFAIGPLAAGRMGPWRTARMVVVTLWIQLKMVVTDPFTGVLQVVWPLFFATGALLIVRQSDDPSLLLYAGLGAAVMGIWSSIATSSSNTLQRERWLGTLELVVSTPTPFALVLVPMSCALATLGFTSLVATLAWGRLVFGIEFGIENPIAFVATVAVTMLAIALVGFLLSVAFVRYRTAWALGNLLEYPGWLLCGFLVPLDRLPDWAATFGRALPPTWGMSAVRAAAAGDPALWDAAVCLLLALAYAAVATLVAESLLRSARRRATLSLT